MVLLEVRVNRPRVMVISDVIIEVRMKYRQLDQHCLNGNGEGERDAPSHQGTNLVGSARQSQAA
jgi:hypothetical protein